MKKRFSPASFAINFIIALVLVMVVAQPTLPHALAISAGISVASATVQYFVPQVNGALYMALQKQVWTSELQLNPFPDSSFVQKSKDLSEYVDYNAINLQEAGIEPAVFEDYFAGSETALPLASIQDIPNQVLLHTYSTEQTRHRNLQDVELSYDKRASVIVRHKQALDRNMGIRAAFAWTPAATNAFNKLTTLGSDSAIDAIIDIQTFMKGLDLNGDLNMCLTPDLMGKIRKEDKVLYKDIMNENKMYGFNVFQYTKSPLFTAAGVKRPLGSVADPTDKRASFFWATEEAFRAMGTVDMYATLNSSEFQADTLSFAQRALVGAIRAANPKYFAAII